MTALLHTPAEAAVWLRARVAGSLFADSRNVKSGDGFIAWPGAAHDSRQYVNDALNAGASACLVENSGLEAYGFSSDAVAAFAGLKNAAAPIAAEYFDFPSKQLHTVAVTGTNGKTSTTWWLAHALDRLGHQCAMVGTLGIGAPGTPGVAGTAGAMVFNGLTTPDPVLLQQQLRRFVSEGFKACAVEASSIGIAEKRLDGTFFQVAVFTNFTQDHLDYHGSMQEYWAAKASLFDWAGLKSAVVNIDDDKGLELSLQIRTSSLDLWTVAIDLPARLQAQNIEQHSGSTVFDVVEANERKKVTASFIGLYNVSNLLGVIGALRALGFSLGDAVGACCNLPAVPGRLNTLGGKSGSPLVVVDYAHTPDAIDKVLLALKPVAKARGGQLWCVFGCGGERDESKRPLMAASAQKTADKVVVTSDNPRGEDPAKIIDQIAQGFTNRAAVQVQTDRAKAIAQTIANAQSSDVVLLAGKGHENYQDVKGIKYPFDDAAHAQSALNLWQLTGCAS